MSKLSVDQIVLKRLRKYIYGCRIMRGKTSGHLKEHWTRKLAHYRKQMAMARLARRRNSGVTAISGNGAWGVRRLPHVAIWDSQYAVVPNSNILSR